MEFQEFLESQEEVYNRFRDTRFIKKNGFTPNVVVKQGGYLIILRHSKELSEKVSGFSKRISDTLPTIVYDSQSIHTLISDYQIDRRFSLDINVLHGLSRAVSGINKQTPVINYFEWLYNKNSVIVCGRPNNGFFQISQNVIKNAMDQGIELRMPWGSHITASRINKRVKPDSKELFDFFKLMKEAPMIRESRPEFIDVGYFYLGPDGFDINVYDRVSLLTYSK